MGNEVAKKPEKLQVLLKSGAIQERLKSMLEKNSSAFETSIINVVNGSNQLQLCDPMTVIKAAMIAASLNLAVDPNLGFSAIVPYKNKGVMEAQFQMMYKGFVQLAIRSGQYKTINVTEVYKDELEIHNPFTGEVTFTDFENWKMRYSDDGEVVGYFAYYSLLTGFEKSMYMTKGEIEKHAMKYSQSYKSDKKKGYKYSRWSQDFDAMGKKTVLKLLLSKYGVLSTEMQKAVIFDQSKISGTLDNPEAEFIDNQKEIIEVPKQFDMTKDENKETKVDAEPTDLTGSPFDTKEEK